MTTVVITAVPVATFSYTGSPYCQTAVNPSPTFSGGGVAGNFTSTSGLVFVNASTGQINLSASTPGAYIVTNTIAAANGCAAVTATSNVTITALPIATFSYTGSPYCKNGTNPTPTFSGGGVAGIFSSTAGLVFVSTSTGQINLATSTAGTYTVTNSIAAANGCGIVTATSTVTVTAVPTAAISYAGTPFCVTASPRAVTLNGTGAISGGTYSSTAGLTLDATTGTITPATSTAGTYTVTYTIPASGGCAAVPVTTSVTITDVPTAVISYAGTPFCRSLTSGQSPTLTGTGAFSGGTYSSTTGLSINSSTGAITPSTSTAGTYTVTYTTPVSGGCSAVSVMTTVVITAEPSIANAGPNQVGPSTCGILSTTLAANQPTVGVGQWTIDVNNGNGMLQNPNAFNSMFSGTVGFTYVLRWTISNSPCASSSSTVNILFNETPPTANAGTPLSLCSEPSTSSINVTTGSSASNFTSIIWSSSGSGSWTNINSLTLATYTPSAADRAAGTVNITLTALGNGSAVCNNASSTKILTIGAPVIPGSLTIVGASNPNNVKTFCLTSDGTINLSGHTGIISKWQSSTNGGGTWQDIANTTSTLNYTGVNTTTIYRVELLSTICGVDYSDIAVVSVILPVDPSPVTASPPSICLGDSSILTANTGFNLPGSAVDGTFNQANPPGWQVRVNGVPNNFPANANNSVTNEWSESNGPKTFFGPPDGPAVTYNNVQAGLDGKFAVATGVINSTLETPIFSLVGTPTAALTLFSAFRFYGASYGRIEISTNGGASYQPTPLASFQGDSSLGTTQNGWLPLNYDLSNYIGQNNLRIRFSFSGANGPILSTWAMDGLGIPSVAPSPTYAWSPTATLSSGTGSPLIASPTVTTTYNLTSTINGCTGGTALVTVTVNQLAKITPSGIIPTVCARTVAQPVSISYSDAINGANTYSIRWRTTPANSFAPVTNSTLPGGAISIIVPANTAPGRYAAYLTVANSATGCSAPGDSIYIDVVTPASISAQPVSPEACVGGSVVMSSGANNLAVGGALRWEVKTTATGTWTDLADVAPYSGVTTQNLTVSNVSIAMVDYEFRMRVNSGAPCNDLLYSNPVKIRIKNVWTGGTSIDWMTGSNWSNGAPPTLNCLNTYILGGRSFQPTLSNGTGTVNNLIIEPNAYLTVNGTGKLGVAGLITRDASATLDLLAGELLLFGNTTNPFSMVPQVIEGPIFKEKTIKRLTVDNNVNVIGTDTLKISHAIGFDVATNGKTFNASDKNVSLLSTINYTANLNEIKNGNSVLGNNFTVERYISTGSVHGQSWQLLSTAITGQSIFNSWQEGGIYKPGLGTRITSPLSSPSGSLGFDGYTQRDAMKVYNPNIVEYDGVTNTNTNALANPNGYYIFVRGDRSVLSAANAANPTTLRSTGTPNIGNALPPVAVQAGLYASIGNPYPSTFDLRKLYTDHSSFLTFDVYVWDPTLGGLYGVGGYRTLTYLAGDYNAVPAGGFYSSITNLIQSGQAFFVRSKGPAGGVTFKESYKEDTSKLASRTARTHADIPIIQTSLKGGNVGAPQVLLDGALAVFGDEYSNNVNFDDASKFINVGVNTGFVRSGKILAVERMKLPTEADTMHINFSGARQLAYTWSIKIENLEDAGVEAFLWDKFLNTRTPLSISGNTDVTFGVNTTAASIAADRFKIVFKKVILPVRLVGITAVRTNDRTVTVNWKVVNEINVVNYTVERSADGISFNSISVTTPLYNTGVNADYTYLDAAPLYTDCYYRIKAVSQSGLVQYSSKVKVDALNLPPSISVNPNPIVNREMNLVFVNKAKGRYNIQITNSLGQVVYNGEVVLGGMIENKKISLTNLTTAGIYQLSIKAQDGSTNRIQQILVK